MIRKPQELDFSEKNIIMIVAGLPGVGKTTLALSAPGVLLIDADEGLARVNPEHRRDASVCKNYEELLADIEAAKGQYKTIVIDTCGALIDMLKDWAMRTEPATAKKKSGGISMQGFGIVKSEFIRLSAQLRKDFNVIYLFHAQKDKTDDGVFYDIIAEGSAKNIVWQPADLGAFLHIVNGERYLGFSPTEQYNAKAAYGIKGLVRVPELKDGEPNNFLEKLFAQVKSNLRADIEKYAPEREKYEAAIKSGNTIIAEIDGAEDIAPAKEALAKISHALTSKDELAAKLKARIAELGLKYNRTTKSYEQA